jgi:hypothetical protein
MLHCNIEVEGFGGVGEDLVGKSISDLLDKSLGSKVGRPADRGELNWLAKW